MRPEPVWFDSSFAIFSPHAAPKLRRDILLTSKSAEAEDANKCNKLPNVFHSETSHTTISLYELSRTSLPHPPGSKRCWPSRTTSSWVSSAMKFIFLHPLLCFIIVSRLFFFFSGCLFSRKELASVVNIPVAPHDQASHRLLEERARTRQALAGIV